MNKYTTLENISINILYDIFIESFQDFPIASESNLKTFHEMLKNNKYNPMISIGAFNTQTNELMGYVLNNINEKSDNTEYAILCATRPKFRRQGIMYKILENTKQLLKQNQVVFYMTEVLQNNTPALKLYESQGFVIRNEIITEIQTKTNSRYINQYELILKI